MRESELWVIILFCLTTEITVSYRTYISAGYEESIIKIDEKQEWIPNENEEWPENFFPLW